MQAHTPMEPPVPHQAPEFDEEGNVLIEEDLEEEEEEKEEEEDE